MKLTPLFSVVGLAVGCADPSSDPGVPAVDRSAPHVQIVSPARGTIGGDVARVLVTGTVTDEDGDLAAVAVNGVRATVAADGTWSAEVAVTPGTTLLRAVAYDERAHEGEATRAFVSGPMAALDGAITGGVRSGLSAKTLATVGAEIAAVIESGGLATAITGNTPVVNVGGGPDCLYGQLAVAGVTVANADVQMPPTTGGVALAATLDNVRIEMQLQWAAACSETTSTIVVSAQQVSVKGLLAIGVVNRDLDIQLDRPEVLVTGFDVQAPGVPQTLVASLDLDGAVGTMLGLVTERIAVPMVAQPLSVLEQQQTLDVDGMLVDVVVEPAKIDFTPNGGSIALDTSWRARGDRGTFVHVPNRVPALDMTHGIELAVADDAMNQLLASLWSAKAFDTTVALEATNGKHISKHYDRVRLQLLVPPHVEADGSPLQLTVGDWVATFERDGIPATTVAIHAKSALYAEENADGELRLAVSTPTATIDVVDGAPLTKEQHDLIRAFAIDRIKTLGSTAVAAIPLPAIGNPLLPTPWLDPKRGYLYIEGDIEGVGP